VCDIVDLPPGLYTYGCQVREQILPPPPSAPQVQDGFGGWVGVVVVD
jgi:hypothetical protein